MFLFVSFFTLFFPLSLPPSLSLPSSPRTKRRLGPYTCKTGYTYSYKVQYSYKVFSPHRPPSLLSLRARLADYTRLYPTIADYSPTIARLYPTIADYSRTRCPREPAPGGRQPTADGVTTAARTPDIPPPSHLMMTS